jgi:hypothetical protein
VVPRDEIIASLQNDDSGDKKKKKQDEETVDLSLLGTSDDVSEIDAGVTSGADPSEWDPINIDRPR